MMPFFLLSVPEFDNLSNPCWTWEMVFNVYEYKLNMVAS
jgi:hypothetical protein